MPRKKVHKVTIAKFSPFRSVTWRYDRVTDLINQTDGKRPVRNVDDEHICRAFAFIRKWSYVCQTTEPIDQLDKLAELFPDDPALYYAYEVFQRPADDWTKATLEARLLAGQSDEVIAANLCIYYPETIDLYEKLFFNVRDRLHSADYISKQVIGPLIGIGHHNTRMTLSTKFFGYYGGEQMLEYMLNGIDRTIPLPKAGDGINDFADEFFGSMVRSRSMLTAATFQMDEYKIIPLMDLHTRLIEIHTQAKLASGPKSQFEEMVGVMLSAVPWSVGDSREKQAKDGPLRHYIGAAVEPRAANLLKLATGEEVPGLENIAERKLPEAKFKRDPNEYAKQGSRREDS